jgi:hypothetical protein
LKHAREFIKRVEIGVEEIILSSLIILEVIDFLAIIPPSLEFAEKIFSVAGMAYLFWKASITRISFGKQCKTKDAIIVSAYLLLSFKTVIGYMINEAHEASAVGWIYAQLVTNADTIEKAGFYAGTIMLMAVAALTVREKAKKPSIMQMIHETEAGTATHKIIRFFSTYIILLAIYLLVFTFAFEWLGMVIDAAILIIILFFYLFVIVKRGKRMGTESFLKKVSDTSEEYYEKFVSLFHSRKTVVLAITGLLVLHLLVEVGSFVIPYTTGFMYSQYLHYLGEGHTPLAQLMATDFVLAEKASLQLAVLLAYALNVLAVLFLFFGPAYAWVKFHGKTKIPRISWLFFGSIATFILLPVFRIQEAASTSVIGVDIQTQRLHDVHLAGMVLLVSIIVMGVFHILERINAGRAMKLAFLAVFTYFGKYLYHFFMDSAKYYSSATGILAGRGQYYIAAHLLIFFALTIIFYVGGYILFLHEAYIKQKI